MEDRAHAVDRNQAVKGPQLLRLVADALAEYIEESEHQGEPMSLADFALWISEDE